jgi:hypothetical protein
VVSQVTQAEEGVVYFNGRPIFIPAVIAADGEAEFTIDRQLEYLGRASLLAPCTREETPVLWSRLCLPAPHGEGLTVRQLNAPHNLSPCYT